MQKCSICEKPIYGRATSKKGTLVCGSCPLNRAQGATDKSKSYSEIRMDMAKLVTQQTPVFQEGYMADLIVKSNSKNRTILLDGRFPVVFGPDGMGKCPAHLRSLFEREMMMRPGRYSIIEPSVPEPVVEAAPVEVPVVEVPAAVEPEAVPAEVDQSFLTEEPVKPKASKKK